MPYHLGVDTGGTYTDAVLIQDGTHVIAKAKSLTTRHDLAIGIGNAIRATLDQADINRADITFAALSTTLATNALVEGHGARVGLVYIGFSEKDLKTQGLLDALGGDPYILLEGGHDHAGQAKAPLDHEALHNWITAQKGLEALAIAAKFAPRNPEHETQAQEIALTHGLPCSLSHQLSAKLNGPKRAITAVLNARLISMIDRLIARAQDELRAQGIEAPLMVVRGDGALMSARVARERPIETILSGPAASLVGALWLTKTDTAIVSDIGGTTTDVALLQNGRPSIDPMGARVGPYRTMVEAVAMRTTGLGGDSQTHPLQEGLNGGVRLGPSRVIPVSLLARDFPAVVHEALDAQIRRSTPSEMDAHFILRLKPVPDDIDGRERGVLDRISTTPQPLATALVSRPDRASVTKLISRGLVQISTLTPTDASHIMGQADLYDTAAATKAAELFARLRTGAGTPIAPTGTQLAQMVLDQMTAQSVHAILEASLFEEEERFGTDPHSYAAHPLMTAGLDHHQNVLRFNIGLNVPLIPLGASAPIYYPPIAARLGTALHLPEHADVANAVGAVVGQIIVRKSGQITAPAEGQYRVHLPQGPAIFTNEGDAIIALRAHLTDTAIHEAQEAGAEDIDTHLDQDIKRATSENREIFIEATLTVEATGRPRFAHG